MKFLDLNYFFLFTFCCSNLLAQHIVVRNELTGDIISDVTIHNQYKSTMAITDDKGSFSLSSFNNNDMIVFVHIGFEERVMSYEALRSEKVVFLFPDTQSLNEIVLSVSRSSTKKKQISKQVNIIQSDEIAFHSPQTSAEVLTLSPGIRIQKSQGAGGSPVIRGFEANRVLLVVDGVRMNNAIYRSGHLQNAITIDPNSLSRTEVIFGPSSVGYGSDAMGGVVHYYTKEPRINNQSRWEFGASNSYDFHQRSSLNNIHLEYSDKKWGSFTSLSYSNFGDVRMGKNRKHGYENWGKVFDYSKNDNDTFFEESHSNSKSYLQKNSGYDQFDLLQKWVYVINSNTRFSLNTQFSTSSEIGRFDKLSEIQDDGTLKFAEWRYGPQKRLFIAPSLKINHSNKWLSKATLTLAYQAIEESRIKRRFGKFNRETQLEHVDVFSFNADLFAHLSEHNSLSYGVEFTHNIVDSEAYEQNLIVSGNQVTGLGLTSHIPTRYPSAGSTYTTWALYADYHTDLSEKSTLNSGIRYTSTHLNAEWNDQALIDARLSETSNSNGAINAALGYVYRPNAKWDIRTGVSSGFRSPNVDDLGKIRENNGKLTIPNPELKPEYAYNSEIGITRYFNKRKSYFQANVYYTWVNNYIGRNLYPLLSDTSTDNIFTMLFAGEEVETIANVNLGDAKIYGGVLDWSIDLSHHIAYKGSLTFTDAVGVSDDMPLPSISPLFGNQRLVWENKNTVVEFAFYHSSSKEPGDFSKGGEDGLEETPLINPDAATDEERFAGALSWERFDLNTQHRFSSHLAFGIQLENILNIHYRSFASGISAPGRSFKLIVNYRF